MNSDTKKEKQFPSNRSIHSPTSNNQVTIAGLRSPITKASTTQQPRVSLRTEGRVRPEIKNVSSQKVLNDEKSTFDQEKQQLLKQIEDLKSQYAAIQAELQSAQTATSTKVNELAKQQHVIVDLNTQATANTIELNKLKIANKLLEEQQSKTANLQFKIGCILAVSSAVILVLATLMLLSVPTGGIVGAILLGATGTTTGITAYCLFKAKPKETDVSSQQAILN